jgi:ABC-2 type transport system ATP-binding protein
VNVAELDSVSKRFGAVTALDDVSFAVERGEVVALLGPNGAGKSTALGVLLGLRCPDGGVARLLGGDPHHTSSRREVGVTPQETVFPTTLRVQELVDLVRAHYERPLPAATVLTRFGLAEFATRQLGGLSGGERRRVGVALAFAGAPRLVVLDEPTTGLDLLARHAVWDAIRQHADDGGTILFTTHQLEEADTLATRAILIEAGAIVADGTVAEIKAAAGLTRVAFRAQVHVELEDAEHDGAFVRILTSDAGATVERLVRAGIPLVDLEVRPLTLEEALVARGAER